jgi:hypothetical protein
MFMSDVPTATSADTQPSRVGRLLALVRKLIDYGRDLAAKVQRRDPATEIRHFDTSDIALILARITQGLHRAQVLEERLVRNAARLDAPRRQTTPATHKQRATRPAAECSQAGDPPLALLPTAERIAARHATGLDPVDRRRPIGAVLADICRDLGILPSHPLWRELSDAIMLNGGNLARLVKEIIAQGALRFAQAWAETPIHPLQLLPSPSHTGTGPP